MTATTPHARSAADNAHPRSASVILVSRQGLIRHVTLPRKIYVRLSQPLRGFFSDSGASACVYIDPLSGCFDSLATEKVFSSQQQLKSIDLIDSRFFKVPIRLPFMSTRNGTLFHIRLSTRWPSLAACEQHRCT